jgi:hypothetical protein
MKILGPLAAVTVLVLPLDDVRPIQGITPQQIIEVLAPKYKFATRPRVAGASPLAGRLPLSATATAGATGPATMQMLIQMPLTLQNGTATFGEQNILISRLDIFPDVSRIVVQTVTTDEGDIIADDICSVLEAVFGFRNVRELSTRQYVSNCLVQFEKGIEERLQVFRDIKKILSPALQSATGINEEPQFERIVFSFDPTLIPASKTQLATGFTMERRVEHPYSENRYVSGAPLRTNELNRVMEQLGELIERGA